MKEKLLQIFNKKCNDWDTWINSFDSFIGNKPRDSNEKMFYYKDTPSYCIWYTTESEIITISYRYVNILHINGDMYCLQDCNTTKINAMNNYKKLKTRSYLPNLKEHTKYHNLMYTHFASPTKELGYPPPYMLFNIMMNSSNTPVEFKNYIKNLIDQYIDLLENCIQSEIPLYNFYRILTNHFVDKKHLYFKDNIFFVSNNISLEEIETGLISSIDGFRRAEGVVSAYRDRNDSTVENVNKIFEEIENLKTYARKKCQNLINVNQ